MSKDMDDFNMLELFSEEVVQAHEQIEREDEPYYEEPAPTNLFGCTFTSPFRVINDYYTVY